jgi:hypothetical protein
VIRVACTHSRRNLFRTSVEASKVDRCTGDPDVVKILAWRLLLWPSDPVSKKLSEADGN